MIVLFYMVYSKMEGTYNGINDNIHLITKDELLYTPNEVLIPRYRTSGRLLKRLRVKHGVPPLRRGRRMTEYKDQPIRPGGEPLIKPPEPELPPVPEDIEEDCKCNDTSDVINELQREVYELKGIVKGLLSVKESNDDRKLIDYHKKKELKSKLKNFEDTCCKLTEMERENIILKRYVDINNIRKTIKIKNGLSGVNKEEQESFEMLEKILN